MIQTAEVYLWGTRIGIVHLDEKYGFVTYEYDKDFLHSGIEVSPICMPLSEKVYSFPDLDFQAFRGVPGLLADSLPDKFGNAVIDQWLAKQGRLPDSFNVIERLCYTGKRGMGALEYVPAKGPVSGASESVNIEELVNLASQILQGREQEKLAMTSEITQKQLLQLGTSAGGARAKAIIAWNEETGDIRSGQIDAGDGFGYWLIKFDGVTGNGDHGMEDAPEYTLIEYAYYLMACAAGIQMNECRVLRENGRNHFMTKRFDRGEHGEKIHMQTLGALAHINYNIPCLCSYEQMSLYARSLNLTENEVEQLYRRMVFNVLAVNQDDHVKNFSLLMNRSGKWSLAPAYDMTLAYDPSNHWLCAHQMTINGKNKNISKDDLIHSGISMDLKKIKCRRIIEEVARTVGNWHIYAEKAGVREKTMEDVKTILQNHD